MEWLDYCLFCFFTVDQFTHTNQSLYRTAVTNSVHPFVLCYEIPNILHTLYIPHQEDPDSALPIPEGAQEMEPAATSE